ncbi:MAG: AMP-binding protein [Candidatus Babeliales bacterium]
MFASWQSFFGFSKSLEDDAFKKKYQDILIDGKIMYAGCLLQRAAQLYPDNIALICRDQKITFNELYKKATAVSKRLIAMDVKPRDRVILLFENSIEFYIGYYGIWQIGAVVAALNTFLHERELHHIIQNATPKAMVISNEFASRLEEFAGQELPQYITEDELQQITKTVETDNAFKVHSLEPDEMVALLYTSGTTGFPKGVMLSSKNIMTNLIQGICRTDATPKDRVYAALPLFHSFAQNICVWGSFFVGASTIVIPRIERRLLLEGLEHKPTVAAGVPALYGLFCLMKTVPFDTIRFFITGGDALPDKIRSSFEIIYRRRLCNGYGLTETSPLIAINFDDELLAPNTVGSVSVGIQCSLRDEQGNEVKKGQKGILWVKGDNVMLGYYNAPELTEKAIKDGWFDTGDWGYFDKKGRLIISGRHKDLIIHKGINVYPQEIENVVLTHPAVIQAAVVGKKDVDVGEIPVAFVVLKEKVADLDKELKKLCQQHLASYKIPRQFIVLKQDEIPLTPLRKIDKKRLRKEFLGQDNNS